MDEVPVELINEVIEIDPVFRADLLARLDQLVFNVQLGNSIALFVVGAFAGLLVLFILWRFFKIFLR